VQIETGCRSKPSLGTPRRASKSSTAETISNQTDSQSVRRQKSREEGLYKGPDLDPCVGQRLQKLRVGGVQEADGRDVVPQHEGHHLREGQWLCLLTPVRDSQRTDAQNRLQNQVCNEPLFFLFPFIFGTTVRQ
jgi:hypothetical protein